jgi:hypothetical protein
MRFALVVTVLNGILGLILASIMYCFPNILAISACLASITAQVAFYMYYMYTGFRRRSHNYATWYLPGSIAILSILSIVDISPKIGKFAADKVFLSNIKYYDEIISKIWAEKIACELKCNGTKKFGEFEVAELRICEGELDHVLLVRRSYVRFLDQSYVYWGPGPGCKHDVPVEGPTIATVKPLSETWYRVTPYQ